MKKIFYIIIFILLPSFLFAGNEYEDLVISMQDVAPNIAFYNYQKYQKEHPEVGNLYFQMGSISYDYLKDCNPIKDIVSFNYYAYNSRLYYNSVLHFVNDGDLKKYSKYYYGVIGSNERVSKDDLFTYIKLKLDTVVYYKENGQNLYDAFYRLSTRYELCISEFLNFNRKYSSANDALMLVSNEDINSLNNLLIQSDSIKNDIDLFKEKLSKFPIKDYNPEFIFYPIDFYRVDGLCSVNFLQNKILLYDYSAWVRNFINKYNKRIIPLKEEINNRYANLLISTSFTAPNSLINALYQLDDNSYVASMLQIVSNYNECVNMFDKLNKITSADEGMKLLYKISFISNSSDIDFIKTQNVDSLSYIKYAEFNSSYVKDKVPSVIMTPYINKIHDYYNKSKQYLRSYIESNDSKFDVQEENLNKIRVNLNISDDEILYVLRYLKNSIYVFYNKDGNMYVEEVGI